MVMENNMEKPKVSKDITDWSMEMQFGWRDGKKLPNPDSGVKVIKTPKQVKTK